MHTIESALLSVVQFAAGTLRVGHIVHSVFEVNLKRLHVQEIGSTAYMHTVCLVNDMAECFRVSVGTDHTAR